MKKVAGFQSLNSFFFFIIADWGVFRSGLGIMAAQKEGWRMLGEAAYWRVAIRVRGRDWGRMEVRRFGGVRRIRRRTVDLFIVSSGCWVGT